MSDQAIADAAGTGAAAATDVSGDSSDPAATGTDVFAGHDFDSAFGLEAETPAEPNKTPDVPEATVPPVPHQDTKEDKPGGEEAKPADPKAADDAAKPAEKDGQFAENEKLNWDDDKVPFRTEFKNLKKAYEELRDSSVDAQFVNDPAKFAEWMEETSQTSFNELGQILATRSATEHPKEWMQFLFAQHPDALAELVSGREGMTKDRLQAELSVILDDDDEAVQKRLEQFKEASAPAEEKPAETEEQKRVREILERDEQQEMVRVNSEVFEPIETAINGLVAEAGLDIDQSAYAGKNFDDLDEETQFKVVMNEILIPNAIDYFIKQDPKLVNMQSRLETFLQKKDVKGAKALQHPAQIAATNITAKVLGLITNYKANAKSADERIPAGQPPKAPVGGGAGAGLGAGGDDMTRPLTDDDWKA